MQLKIPGGKLQRRHLPQYQPPLGRSGRDPAKRPERDDMPERMISRRLLVCIPERGHQIIVYVLPKDQPTPPAYQNSPEVAEYFRNCEEGSRRRRGNGGGRLIARPGRSFRTRRCCRTNPARSPSGISAGRI